MFGTDKVLFQFRGPWGIPVQVAPSLLMLALIFVSLLGTADLTISLTFVGMMVLSIFLHELGHAWGCRVQGVGVRRIMLHGGGGFCEHDRVRSADQQELIVAMGPIVNLALWAMASLISPYLSDGLLGSAVHWFAQINLFLAIFNLLPVMPLDGGKLFQLALMRVVPAAQATRMAGWVGLVLSLIWIPTMIWVFFSFGLVLFFIPPVRLHWQMARVET